MLLQRTVVHALAVSSLALSALAQQAVPEPAARPAADNPPEVVRALQEHYRAALAELSAADTSRLSASQRDGRARALDELKAYCERGVFGINREPGTAREPYFVDDGGRLCAVADLMAACGERRLVDQVSTTANHAYVVELAGLPALQQWLERVGLTVEEAARIQAPSTHKAAPTTAAKNPPGLPRGLVASAAPGPAGEAGAPTGATTAGSGVAPGAGDGSSSAGGSTRNSHPASRGQSGRSSPVLSGPAWTPDGSEDDWWLWWEMNKLRFLVPHRLTGVDEASVVSRGTDARTGHPMDGFGARLPGPLAADARDELLPLLLQLTRSGDATLRARAAVTLGRLGGRQAVAPLTALLADDQMLVRHAAILGLGATGSMEAAPTLLHLAADGSLPDGVGRQLSSWARPLAFVALGLGRRHGMSPVLDGFVADLAAEGSRQRSDLGTAALLYQTLSPCEALSAFTLDVLDDSRSAAGPRCRATETLGRMGDAAQLPRLTHLLGDAQVDERRSAALALSGLDHPLALAALETAYELEEEPTARGFLLLAVAEQGGDGAREFLTRAARGGPQAARPWAALGLGLLSRSIADADAGGSDPAAQQARAAIGATLREGLASEANRSALGAWILAAGLARDAASAGPLRGAMVGSRDQRIRMFCALALAMIGDAGSRPLMLEQLRLEEAPLAIVGLTQALGVFGVPEDGPALVAAVREMRVPATQALLAIALAFHGSEAALSGLLEIARDEQASAVARAAAVDGLGLMLDRSPGLMLQGVAASANFDVFPDWLNGMLTSFTL